MDRNYYYLIDKELTFIVQRTKNTKVVCQPLHEAQQAIVYFVYCEGRLHITWLASMYSVSVNTTQQNSICCTSPYLVFFIGFQVLSREPTDGRCVQFHYKNQWFKKLILCSNVKSSFGNLCSATSNRNT
jgi:hypothetical protein